MYLAKGSYIHATNEVTLVIRAETQFSPRREAYAVKVIWIIRGVLLDTTVAGLTARIAALQAAYNFGGDTIALYNDDGSLTAHVLDSSSAIGGVRINRPPTFLKGDGTEYVTKREYEIEVEALYPFTGTALLEFTETVSLSGAGGPRFVYKQPLFGLPIKQQVAQFTTFKATQSGSAVGWFDYPPFPNALFPADEKVDLRSQSRESPSVWNGDAVRFPISWSYTFESNQPLQANPNLGV